MAHGTAEATQAPMTGSASDNPSLVRAIGRWGLAGLVLNGIIGTGVFILPGTIGDRLGWPAMIAWILAAGFTAAMIFSFAEVSSRFSEAGGAYLYSQAAFGRFIGVQMAWMTYLVRTISAAVQANLFTTYLAELWPAVSARPAELVVTTIFIGLHALINVRSVGAGARVSSVFAVVKIIPLILFGILGIAWMVSGKAAPAALASDPSLGGWLQALLLLMFAYGGFESALIPLAEAKDPRRDAPWALITGLALVTVVYLAAQVTVLVTLSEPAANNRPLAASARVMLGNVGAIVITLAALISVYGWVASNMLNVPRLTMAMAERGDLPAIFGKVHPRFRTPWVSIVMFATISWLLAIQAGLIQNLSLSAVSRLFIYGGVCAALPMLRWKERSNTAPPNVGPALFPVRGGTILAVIGVLVSIVLASRMNQREAISLALVVVIATAHWLYLRGKGIRVD